MSLLIFSVCVCVCVCVPVCLFVCAYMCVRFPISMVFHVRFCVFVCVGVGLFVCLRVHVCSVMSVCACVCVWCAHTYSRASNVLAEPALHSGKHAGCW